LLPHLLSCFILLFAYADQGRDRVKGVRSGTTGPQNTLHAYNGRGLQTTITHEETGDVTMAYDTVGNMTKRTDEASVVVDSFYDPSNRLTQRKKSGSTTDVETFVYDALGRMITARKGTRAGDRKTDHIIVLTTPQARRQTAYKSAVRDHPGADQTPLATHAETPPAPPRSLLPSA